jgi:hypothetical protein
VVPHEEAEFAKPFPDLQPVTLSGDYGEKSIKEVAARNRSRFAGNSFSGHFSILLSWYFNEQEKALSEACRARAGRRVICLNHALVDFGRSGAAGHGQRC